jgi:hypothetical protein
VLDRRCDRDSQARNVVGVIRPDHTKILASDTSEDRLLQLAAPGAYTAN